MPGRGRKRATETSVDENVNKRHKISHPTLATAQGLVLTCGEGDVGQLGLGPDVMEKSRPTLVEIPDKIIQVCGGGMHTVCITVKGEVYTFGCNDEGALGRDTSEEGTETRPGKVDNLPKIVQVSAGDSHTAALSDDGRVFIWGNFRDANGSIGLTMKGPQHKPVELLPDEVTVKISSGGDHLACLTDKGDIYTLGCADQGQLGRVAECFSVRGGRKGLAVLLTPTIVKFKRKLKFSDVWAGQYVTFAQEQKTQQIHAWGLNNYYQLGFNDMKNRFVPDQVKSFNFKKWQKIQSGQHHTIALDTDGQVYCVGRAEYGRLGLGENCGEKMEPTKVLIENGSCVDIAAGQSVSFALTSKGQVFGWGMGTSKQLGTGDEEDAWEPVKMTGKQLEHRKVVMVSSGGQHTVLLAQDNGVKS
ncbi:hypothetical protein ACJMK2_040918 [Sinanodonta woodiana]|uniref:RCC1-like domain-containing protein n=1 Tax=Sinanodonta woodiana TaxID=1069815 RepID=A0ABD3W341_SINWO